MVLIDVNDFQSNNYEEKNYETESLVNEINLAN